MGEDDEKYQAEIAGLRHGIDAEMYGDGKAENIVGNAIQEFPRESLYLVSKVYPWNADRHHIYSSLECSLKLMGTDYLDLYLLHWREDADLAETVWCMEDLKQKGKIKRWGVSNFDVEDMEDLWKVPDGDQCCVNQILYNLGTRGIEYDLLEWQQEKKVPFMVYSPVGQAGNLVTEDGVSKAALMTDENVIQVARRHNISLVQLLLAFVLRLEDMIAIPKAVGFDHIDENAAAAAITLTEEDLNQLSASFPAPTEKIPIGDGVAYTAAYYLCGITDVYNWLTISIAHYRFRKGWVCQGHSLDELEYKSPFYPFGSWFCIIVCIAICFGANWWVFTDFNWFDFLTCYAIIPISIIMFFIYKKRRGTIWVKYEDMDLTPLQLLFCGRAFFSFGNRTCRLSVKNADCI